MEIESEAFRALLHKYIEGNCTPEELVQLEFYLHSLPKQIVDDNFAELYSNIDSQSLSHKSTFSVTKEKEQLENILRSEREESETLNRTSLAKSYVHIKRIAGIAAAVLLICFAAVYYWDIFPGHPTSDMLTAKTKIRPEIIDPGKETAILMTDDGKTIDLSAGNNGIISEDSDFRLVRLESGEIQYQSVHTNPATVKWHTVETPRGGQISFVLPDGSKVWLNAASSVRFRSDMNQGIRKVEMTGEAYFDVVKQLGKNFSVSGSFGDIEVLGTKFNVDSYSHSNVRTALLEGSVLLKTAKDNVKMVPSELATINQSGSIKKQYKQNIEDMIAWTKGDFYFEDTDIHTLGQQLARWYNIDVHVESRSIEKKITGTIARDVKLSKMIEMLEYMGLKCAIDDKGLNIN